MKSSVRLVEVGPRDGLQNIRDTVPTSIKIELIKRLREAGLKTIELTSFVSPKAIPQLADCRAVLNDAVIRDMQNDPSLGLPVLVPNLKGLDLAVKHGAKEVAVFISATEGFSKANINCSVAEGLERASKVCAAAKTAGLIVRGYVSCIFADPYGGITPRQAVLHCVKALLTMGCHEVSLGDTLGCGTASDVKSLIGFLVDNGIPPSKLAGHFHDTYGQAVANVWQAYQCGVRVFDSSVGGLGGCPFAPGAKGNVSTEDLVYLFHQGGIDTGVDLDKLIKTGAWISAKLSKQNDSRVGAAITAKQENAMAVPEKRLQWVRAHTTEGLEIYRKGVNIKVVLNRPKNGNALTTTMMNDLTNFFHTSRKDQSISRIALCARGKFFCTGMDLGKGSTVVGQEGPSNDKDGVYDRLVRLLSAIGTAPQVTIACIQGAAYGGGVGLAFACDIRVAVSPAFVTLSEVRLGLCPATISPYVVREWGPAFAREAMLSARKITMTELYERAAIARLAQNEVELEKLLDDYLDELRYSAPRASEMSKELVRINSSNRDENTQQTEIKNLFREMMQAGSESTIGVKKLQEDRKPVDWDALRLSAVQAPKAKL